MGTKAWMVRNDGKSIPVMVHLYAMEDDDFSSEAEVASFLLQYSDQDHDIAKLVLDAWMAKLIEDSGALHNFSDSSISDSSIIESILIKQLNNLPYRFPFPLDIDQYLRIHRELNNFNDWNSLLDFLDKIDDTKETIWKNIADSLNQQFCRVRYGGQYDSISSNNEIWFRISSVGFNWVNVIYDWIATNKDRLNIKYVTICRDMESDYGDFAVNAVEYFYKAKDGTIYDRMPIDDYLSEEHDTSPIFSKTSYNINRGVYYSIRLGLNQGDTFNVIAASTGYDLDIKKRFLAEERKLCIGRME